MARRIKIIFSAKGRPASGWEVKAELNNTKTAEAIYKVLPINAEANTWGEEIYFEIPVEPVEEPDREEVEIGDLGYWPPGNAFCIFFGKTPVSTSDKPKAASKVTVVGRVVGDFRPLAQVADGEKVRIEKN
ncbi:MAG: cyclophilin-like fold protein [bacterium]|nr:cyclophilin-like fold protein [bacterium]